MEERCHHQHHPAPLDMVTDLVLRHDRIGDHIRERAIVTDGSCKDERDLSHDAFIHDPPGDNPVLDCSSDRPGSHHL